MSYELRKSYEDMGIPIHSYSSLSLYESCSYCYYLKYICGIKQKWVSHNLIFGTLIHKILENEEILEDALRLDKLIDEIIEKNLWNKYLKGSSTAKIKSDVKKAGTVIQKNPLIREDKTPVVKKKKELEAFVSMDGWVLQAKIDGASDRNELIEHKTSSSKYTLEKIQESHQHVLYELAFQHAIGIGSSAVIYDIIYKSANPIREQIWVKVSEQEIKRTKAWANNLANKINSQVWKPYKKVGWQHRGWCDYKNLCPYCN
jgi:hypothetical protein